MITVDVRHLLYDKDRTENALGLLLSSVTCSAHVIRMYLSRMRVLIDMHAVQYEVSKCCLESVVALLQPVKRSVKSAGCGARGCRR